MEDNKENVEMKTEESVQHPDSGLDIPTKCVQVTRTIAVNASVTSIDFEGRSDGESLQKILAQLKPRRVILVRGSPNDTEVLAQQAQNAGARVFTPNRGEIIDATTETHIYQVDFLQLQLQSCYSKCLSSKIFLIFTLGSAD